jgi:hypothetical protein
MNPTRRRCGRRSRNIPTAKEVRAKCSTAIPKAPRRAGCGPISTSCATSTISIPSSRTPSSPTITATAGTSAPSSSATAKGNLLDAKAMATYGTEAHIVDPDDPEKWRKAGEGKFVARAPTPASGPHDGHPCREGHAMRRLPLAQDSHGNGLIYGEVANAVEIGCKDCHGTPMPIPTLLTSGPAAPPKGNNLALLRNPDGQRRFEWRHIRRRPPRADPALDRRSRAEWEVSLVKDSGRSRSGTCPQLQSQGRPRQADEPDRAGG